MGAKSNQIVINDAKKAYSNFSNYGVSKVDKDGNTILYFDCPQAYSTKEKNKNNKKHFIDIYIFVFQIKIILNG